MAQRATSLPQPDEGFFALLAEVAQDAIFVADVDSGAIVWCNQRAADLVGWPVEELLGRHQRLLHPPEDAALRHQELRRLARDGSRADVEVLRADGERLRVEVSAKTFEIDGRTLRVSIFRDVTARRAAEAGVRKTATQLAFLSRTAMEFVERVGTDDIYQTMAEHLHEICGGSAVVAVSTYDPHTQRASQRAVVGAGAMLDRVHALLGRPVEGFSFPVDAAYHEQLVTGRSFSSPVDLHDITGGAIPRPIGRALEALYGLSTYTAVGFNYHGDLLGIAGAFFRRGHPPPPDDLLEAYVAQAAIVMQRWGAERVLRDRLEMESVLRRLSTRLMDLPTDRLDDGLVEALQVVAESVGAYRGVMIHLSPGDTPTRRTWEWCADPDDALGERLVATTPEDFASERAWLSSGRALVMRRRGDRPAVERAIERFGGRGRFAPVILVPLMREERFLGALGVGGWPDAERDWAQHEIDLVRGLGDLLVSTVDRRVAHLALARSEARLRRITERSFAALCELDPTGTVTYISPAIERILGYAPEEVVGLSFRDFLAVRDDTRLREVVERIADGRSVPPLRLDATHRDGSTSTLVVAAAPITVEGQHTGVYVIAQDITERIRLEEQVLRMQKLEAVGTLAGGVAHDFNNLLTGILGYSNLLVEESADEEVVREAAEVIEAAAHRASELTQQLLGFARRGKLLSVGVDVHDLVTEVVAILGRTIDKRIEILQRLEAPRSTVIGDPGQIQQVVMNLAVNARDAMSGPGRLEFTTRVEPLGSRELPEGDPTAPCLVLEVSDTGVGMDPEVLERAFEPFFTTKAPGQGVGMGLATVYGIVRNHGGSIEVRTARGEGTTFAVCLPLAGLQESVREPTPAGKPHRGSGRILFVDDEPVVRRVAGRLLTSLGYRVVLAHDGAQAVEIFRERPDDFDLVILDVTMPVMDGRECYAALRGIRPGVRALLSTGHALEGEVQALLDAGMLGFVQKPYVIADLAAAVAAAMPES